MAFFEQFYYNPKTNERAFSRPDALGPESGASPGAAAGSPMAMMASPLHPLLRASQSQHDDPFGTDEPEPQQPPPQMQRTPAAILDQYQRSPQPEPEPQPEPQEAGQLTRDFSSTSGYSPLMPQTSVAQPEPEPEPAPQPAPAPQPEPQTDARSFFESKVNSPSAQRESPRQTPAADADVREWS